MGCSVAGAAVYFPSLEAGFVVGNANGMGIVKAVDTEWLECTPAAEAKWTR